MKTMIFVLLLTLALSACAPAVAIAPAAKPGLPAVAQAPTAKSVLPPAPTAVMPTVAPAAADTATPQTDTAALPTGPAITPWSLVAVGDSVAYNSPDDCRGCTSFVDRYAAAITQATGHPVEAQNLSQHNGLQTDGLLEELKTDVKRREALANADIIVVVIGFNDHAYSDNLDDPCDGPTGAIPDWTKFNATCAAAAAEMLRPKLESVFAQIVALRAGKPTIFRTINHYNDWIGTKNDDGSDLPPEATNASRAVLDTWNAMYCKAAQENGFTCADIYRAFNGPDGLTPSGDLFSPNYHPSDKGNEVIAGVLADLGYAPLVP